MFYGCGWRNAEQRLFKDSVDRYIGHPISVWESAEIPREAKPIAGGGAEHVFTQDNGCSWAFVTDSNDTIVSWHYLSDPSLCRNRLMGLFEVW